MDPNYYCSQYQRLGNLNYSLLKRKIRHRYYLRLYRNRLCLPFRSSRLRYNSKLVRVAWYRDYHAHSGFVDVASNQQSEREKRCEAELDQG